MDTPITPNPMDVGMATGPAPIPAAPSAIQPNPAAQSTQSTAQPGDNSNAPDASTPAAKGMPPALVNNPQVPSQKIAAQIDANKNSVAPAHKSFYDKAVEIMGGPQRTVTSIDAAGNITRTPVRPKPWAFGMALALDVLSGAMAGGSQKNATDAFQAGQAKAKQQQDAVKQANLENDATARADQRYKLEITESNMRLYQAGVTAAKTSLEAAQAFGDNQKVITEPLLDGTIQLPPNASMERKSMDDTAASVANGQTNITKDILFAVGDAQPSRDRNGNQIVIDGKPQTKHDYLIIHGVGPDGKIPFTKAMQDECDKFGVKNIPAAGIGEPPWSFSDIAKGLAQVSSLKNGEMILQMHHDDAHDMLPDHEAQDIDIAKAVKDNPEWNKAVDLLAQAQHSLPGANTHIEDILNVVGQKSVSAQGLLMNYLGLKAKDLDTLHNQRINAAAEAANVKPTGAEIDAQKRLDILTKDPINTANADSIIAAHNKPTAGIVIPEDRYNQAIAFNDQQTTQAGKKAGAEARAKTAAEASGPEIQQLAKDIVGGDLAKVGDVTSYRGGQRIALANALHAEAIAQGKDPNDWSATALKTKADMYEDYKKGKTSDNIQAFDAFLGHANDAMDANDSWRRTGSRLINKPLNEFTKNLKNDPGYISFITALEPVRKEFMSFLNANRAEHESDLKIMQTVLDDAQTPANIETALKQLGKSADIRLRSIGTKWTNTMHQPFPNLISNDGKMTLQRMGIGGNQAAKTVTLQGQKIPVNADGTVTVKGYNYSIGADNRTLTLVK